jgi:SAM-dependent methyltransferase
MSIKLFTQMTEKIDKLSCIQQLTLVVGVMLLTCIIIKISNRLLGQDNIRIEAYRNFGLIDGNVAGSNSSGFILKQDDQMVDDLYVSMYDLLEYNKVRNQFEIGAIIDTCSPTSQSIILDIGTGGGHHVNQLNNISKQIIGIDKSPILIQMARDNYPSLSANFENKDVFDNISFNNNSFTHILCLNNTLYYSENKKLFLENCYNWLMPGGFLVLRLIKKSDLNALNKIKTIRRNVFPSFVPSELLLTEDIKFKNFIYKPEYISVNDIITIFKEDFKFNNGEIRQNERKLYIPSPKSILDIARYIGFIELKMYKNDGLIDDTGDISYLYILQKPN